MGDQVNGELSIVNDLGNDYVISNLLLSSPVVSLTSTFSSSIQQNGKAKENTQVS